MIIFIFFYNFGTIMVREEEEKNVTDRQTEVEEERKKRKMNSLLKLSYQA